MDIPEDSDKPGRPQRAAGTQKRDLELDFVITSAESES